MFFNTMVYEFFQIYEFIRLIGDFIIMVSFLGVQLAGLVFLILNKCINQFKFKLKLILILILIFFSIAYTRFFILTITNGFSTIQQYNSQLLENKVSVERGILVSVVNERRKNTYDKGYQPPILAEVVKFKSHVFENIRKTTDYLKYGCFNGYLKFALEEFVGKDIEMKYVKLHRNTTHVPINCILQIRIIDE